MHKSHPDSDGQKGGNMSITLKELKENYGYKKDYNGISMCKDIMVPKGGCVHTLIPAGAYREFTRVDENGLERKELLDLCIEMVSVKIMEIGELRPTIAIVQEKDSDYTEVPSTILEDVDVDENNVRCIAIGTKVWCNVEEDGNICFVVDCNIEGQKVFEDGKMLNGR